MLNKTKKVAFLTTGLAGALVVSSAVGIALSSCTTSSNTSSSDTSNKFTYSIDWTDQNQLKQLTIDEQGLVYSSADKSEIITVAPNTAATSFIIPASVKYITGYNLITRNSSGAVATSTSYGAFQNQTSLISITFASSDTLVSIGDSSFKGCTYLSSMTLPTSTTVVYNNAFENCTNLRNIGLTNVTYIGSSAFKNAMVNGADVSIDLSSATYIGDNAFENSTSLANVDLSKNTALTYIGKSAFTGSLISGSSTTTIDLSKASALKTISDSAFAGCTNLGSVVLPSTGVLTTIGANAFNGATSLTQVGSTANTFTAPSSLGNYAATTATDTVPSYVTSGIGTHAFDGTKIATIDLSALTATTPFTNATFKNMTSLATVNFGSSSKITTIPYSLFENDTALTTLTLPSSITTINDGSNNSTQDTNDTTPYDGRSPFYNSGLVTINMNSITSYATGNITFTDSVQVDATSVVPTNLFQGLTSLTTVYLKAGTVGINTSAFDGTTALTTVKEGSSVTNTTEGDGFSIPATLGWVGYYVFRNSGIKTVSFANNSNDANNNLWFLGQGVFNGATSLTTVDLSQANTTTSHTISASYVSTSSGELIGTGLFAIPSSLFNGASALISVKLPTSVTKIYSDAFLGNTNLTTVNFGDLTKLDTINTGNFNNTQLIDIDFSNISDATTINTLSSSFTGSASIFTGLPTNAVVKLPAAMTFTTALSNSTFTTTSGSTTSHVAITYPNGLNITTRTNATSGSTRYVSIGSSGASDNTQGNSMLAYVSGNFNLASSNGGSSIQEYYPKTFFGNTKLEQLTLSASNLYNTGGTAQSPTYSQLNALFIHHRGGNSFTSGGNYYTSQYLPFGGNSSLTNLVFTGFNITTSRDTDESSSNNPLYKTTNITWAQVSTIINKFAANTTNTPTAWPSITNASSAADGTSKIQYDSVFSGKEITDTGDTQGDYQVQVTSSYGTDEGSSTTGNSETLSKTFAKQLSETDVLTWSFIHNGVTWTLNVVPNGAITLVGENINVYRASKNNVQTGNLNPWQICFNQGETAASKITVTLNIYTPTTSTK